MNNVFLENFENLYKSGKSKGKVVEWHVGEKFYIPSSCIL